MLRLQSVVILFGFLLLFQSTTAQLSQAPRQYHFINSSMNWYEAQSFCRLKHTDLATVDNKDDHNRLVSALGGHVTSSWIGLLKGGPHRWMWSDGSGRVHYTNWRAGEPNNVKGNEQCADISETGMWVDLSCEQKKPFVCYERQEDGKERYVYYTEQITWMNSLKLCRDRHMDLAYIQSRKDNSEISNLVSTARVWIGLFTDNWMWSDGRETSFRYWLRDTQYVGNCASVAPSQGGRWVDARCDQKATFVCQGGLKVKKTLVRMKMRSDVDLTDSTVSEALLKKLETVLSAQSLTDFTLSWRSDKSELVFQRQEQLKVTEQTGC